MRIQKFVSLAGLCLLIAPLSMYGFEGTEVGSSHSPMTHNIPAPTPVERIKGSPPLPPNPPLPALLDGRLQPKFVNKLVNVVDTKFIFKPHCKTEDGIDLYKIHSKPFMADVGIVNLHNQRLYTPMYGFGAKDQPPTYPGRTIVVDSHQTIKVLWKNLLINKKTGLPLPQLTYVPVDETIHTAMPMNPPYPQSGIPTVVHLHGGFTDQYSDGYPEAWATPNFAQRGPFFKKKVFDYTNEQESMLLWYHDHALGYTRLNNYAGTIGAYVIRDRMEKKLIKENKIPSGPYEMPLIITDKMFTEQGELFFPYYDPSNPNQPQPSVLPEFFGDFMLVNGKAWPYAKVEPREYRLRILNGCDSRFLDLHFVPNEDTPVVMQLRPSLDISFSQIGTDQGFLNRPVTITHLLIAPGQRADLVVDFSQFRHQTLILTNTANEPYPDGDPVDPSSTGIVMSFKVGKTCNSKYPLSKLPHTLRDHPIKRLKPTAPNRQVLLFEMMDSYSRIMPMLGTPQLGALHWDHPVTETPLLGSTEIWEIYNTTMDAHPIHLHSGNFQILDRQYFTGVQDPMTGVLTNIVMLGSPMPPLPAERGLFDTAIAPPCSEGAPIDACGIRTRIIMKFTLPGQYVWHCHILSHEDHDMMRPMYVRKK